MSNNQAHTRSHQILTLSANNEIELNYYTANLLKYLEKYTSVELADIAYTLNLSQEVKHCRRAIFAASVEEALEAIWEKDKCNYLTSINKKFYEPKIIFMFPPGQGVQYINMTNELYSKEQIFKENLDICAEKFKNILGFDFREYLYVTTLPSELVNHFNEILVSQPIIFSVELAFTKLLETWGIKPHAMFGYSTGELVAAHVAGVLSLDDAIKYVAESGKAMQASNSGSMLAVYLSAKDLKTYLDNTTIEIASYSAENLQILSGSSEELELLQKKLSQNNVEHKLLPSTKAVHSQFMLNTRESLAKITESLKISKPLIPYISCLTGTWISEQDLNNAHYWNELFIKPMKISSAYKTISDKFSNFILLEIGPGKSLGALAKLNFCASEKFCHFNVLPVPPINEQKHLLYMLANLYLKNVPVNWSAFYAHETRCSKPLPESPFVQINPVLKKEKKAPECSALIVDPPISKNEQALVKIFQDVLGLKLIGVNDNFFELGGDSIQAMQCVARARQTGIHITLEKFIQHPTVSYLASLEITPSQLFQSKTDYGRVPLTPLQVRFFRKPKHWSETKLIPILVKVKSDIDVDRLEAACQTIIDTHDATRLRFAYTEGQWKQYVVAREDAAFDVVDLSDVGRVDKRAAIAACIADFKGRFHLEDGPMVRFVLMQFNPHEPYILLIAFHHLCIDGVSVRIILQDLDLYYQELGEKSLHKAEACKTSTFKAFAEHLNNYVSSKNLNEDLNYWIKNAAREVTELPIDYNYSGQINTVEDLREVFVHLDEEVTGKLIKLIPSQHKIIGGHDVILTAVLQAFNDWTGKSSLLIDIRRHGRDVFQECLDLTRTVGWLTLVYPVNFIMSSLNGSQKLVKAIANQIEEASNHGISYGLLRYLHPNTEINSILENLPKAQVTFNYHGQLDRILPKGCAFKLMNDTIANYSGSQATRSHLINVDVVIKNRKITLVLAYSKSLHRVETIEKLAASFKNKLDALMDALL